MMLLWGMNLSSIGSTSSEKSSSCLAIENSSQFSGTCFSKGSA